jgi:hypothetical protein
VINQNINEIKNIISSRRKKTNCFSFYNEIISWIENSQADLYLIEDCVFIFYEANGFYKFYYYVDKFEKISLSKNLLNKYKSQNKVSLEFTTKNGKDIEELTNAITFIGFNFYAEIVRIIQGQNTFTVEEKISKTQSPMYYELATLDDKNELLGIMHREFDVLKDDIPTEEELIKLIYNKSIVVKHIDNKIILIQIYEYSKGALYSRMTWIEKSYRKPKYTVDLYKGLDEYLYDLNIESYKNLRSYGWIDKNNKNLKINLKFGAQLDGVTCTIFLYDDIKG